jgi:thioredoxin 1
MRGEKFFFLFFVVYFLCSFSFFMAHITITDESFEQDVLHSDLPVLVDFWAPWCGPCQMMGPAIDKLAEEFEGKAKVGKVNVDEYQERASEYGVQGIPSLKIFKGGNVVDEITGAVSIDVLRKKLEDVIVS